MTQTKTFVEVEGPVRAWLRAQALSGIGSRVFFGVPDGATFPLITLALLDGAPQAGEAPLADPIISFDVWGGSKAEASAAAWSLVGAVESIAAGTPLDSPETLRCEGASVVLGPAFRPDPADDKPRYVVDVMFTVKAA